MFVETYIALALLPLLIAVALAHYANRAYQQARYMQRLQERGPLYLIHDDWEYALPPGIHDHVDGEV